MEFPGGRRKAFTLSYDDGIRQDKRFVEILDRYGLKATFNINSGLFDEKISGHDDIWYATNIEIYDYTKAYERLVVSADSKMIYNPSVIPVWFKQGALNDEGRFCIQPGETLRLK